MKIDTLQDLFAHELKDLYSAEKQLLKGLEKMVSNASHEALRAAFEQHMSETEKHVERIEKIMSGMEKAPHGERCDAMEGLIAEAKEALENTENGDVRDAAMIGAAQRVEHYEIAAYGTARTYARMLGNKEAEKILSQTLDEEKATDAKLTQLAEEMVNWDAFHHDGKPAARS